MGRQSAIGRSASARIFAGDRRRRRNCWRTGHSCPSCNRRGRRSSTEQWQGRLRTRPPHRGLPGTSYRRTSHTGRRRSLPSGTNRYNRDCWSRAVHRRMYRNPPLSLRSPEPLRTEHQPTLPGVRLGGGRASAPSRPRPRRPQGTARPASCPVASSSRCHPPGWLSYLLGTAADKRDRNPSSVRSQRRSERRG